MKLFVCRSLVLVFSLVLLLTISVKSQPGWSTWSSWGACSATCDGGNRLRQRKCLDNNFCLGIEDHRENCQNIPCPMDGGWENWISWTPCSSTCGPGISARSRNCDNPRPEYGGKFCMGGNRANIDNENVETQWKFCNAAACPGAPPLGLRILPTLPPTATTATPATPPPPPVIPSIQILPRHIHIVRPPVPHLIRTPRRHLLIVKPPAPPAPPAPPVPPAPSAPAPPAPAPLAPAPPAPAPAPAPVPQPINPLQTVPSILPTPGSSPSPQHRNQPFMPHQNQPINTHRNQVFTPHTNQAAVTQSSPINNLAGNQPVGHRMTENHLVFSTLRGR